MTPMMLQMPLIDKTCSHHYECKYDRDSIGHSLHINLFRLLLYILSREEMRPHRVEEPSVVGRDATDFTRGHFDSKYVSFGTIYKTKV